MPINLCTVPGCYNYGRYCRLHLTQSFKPAAPIKKAADSKKESNNQYKKLAKQFITTHPKCQVKGCKRVAEHIHHKRGRVGELLLDVKHFMAVCPDHHRQIEDDPAWAKKEGYSESRLQKKIPS